jgi:hypothetical protein
MPDVSGIKPSELRLRVLLAREGDGNELALQVGECEERIGTAWGELDELLGREYLAGVGPFVRDDFTAAMRAWRHKTEAMASSYHHHYRAHSAALTAGRDVITEIARQAPRTLH